jgi:hypothetical protein
MVVNETMVGLLIALCNGFVDHQGSNVLFQADYAYRPAPIGNPLKGLVPYASEHQDSFPHSLEFSYLNLSDLMIGPDSFDWTKLEALLNSVAKRGHQTIFRVTVEYPGQPSGIPQFLIKNGLKFIKFPDSGSIDKSQVNEVPDYNNPDLQNALIKFIGSLGAKYDGDPRIGFISAGLLGFWGEWHNYPKDNLFASKDLQEKVLLAYERSIRTTPVLLRYPRSSDDSRYAGNANRPFGYHDDSFAWATLETSKKEESWLFMSTMRLAGQSALEKWKRYPIGGEIRPEAWGIVFDPIPSKPEVQDFDKCVQATHVSWLMDSGMFNKSQSADRIKSAMTKVSKMGYEYSVSRTSGYGSNKHLTTISIEIDNKGVAPFYAKWPLEIAVNGNSGSGLTQQQLVGFVPLILPGQTQSLTFQLKPPISSNKGTLLIRVVNPLKGGVPFRFANVNQDADVSGWLTLKRFTPK